MARTPLQLGHYLALLWFLFPVSLVFPVLPFPPDSARETRRMSIKAPNLTAPTFQASQWDKQNTENTSTFREQYNQPHPISTGQTDGNTGVEVKSQGHMPLCICSPEIPSKERGVPLSESGSCFDNESDIGDLPSTESRTTTDICSKRLLASCFDPEPWNETKYCW